MTNVGSHVPYAKDGATWKQWDEFYALDGSTWKPAASVYVNDNGTWKEVWNHAPLVTSTSSSDSTQTPTFVDVAATNYGRGSATLGYSGYLSDSATEFFYLYRKSGVNTYTEDSDGSLTGLEFGGATGTTYYHKTVGYNGKRRITVNATANSNGVGGVNEFPLTSAQVEFSSSSTFASNVTTVTLGIPTPTNNVYTFQHTYTLPTLARGATDTYSTVYYRFTFTNAAGTVVSSTGSRSLSPKYSPSNYATVATGEKSFTTYPVRSAEYYWTKSNTSSYTWTHPSIPSGGVYVDNLAYTIVGGGGGGGRTDRNGPGGMGAGGGGGGGEYKTGTISVGGGKNATITAPLGGLGAALGTLNGNGGGSATIATNTETYTASGGTGGIGSDSNSTNIYPNGGSSGANAGGAGLRGDDTSNYQQMGGGGAGAGGAGNAGNAYGPGSGGSGVGDKCGGGGGVGSAYAFPTVAQYGAAGGSGGGGSGVVNGNGGDATGYGGGGGASIFGTGGNGGQGYIYIWWYGP